MLQCRHQESVPAPCQGCKDARTVLSVLSGACCLFCEVNRGGKGGGSTVQALPGLGDLLEESSVAAARL